MSWLKYLPKGYCPPSLGKHQIRHLPKGSYGGNMVGGQPDGFGSSSWYVPPPTCQTIAGRQLLVLRSMTSMAAVSQSSDM